MGRRNRWPQAPRAAAPQPPQGPLWIRLALVCSHMCVRVCAGVCARLYIPEMRGNLGGPCAMTGLGRDEKLQ